jgi:hypothetical protein
MHICLIHCFSADDWNLGEKSGRWRRQVVQQRLQFDFDVETFFTVDVVTIHDQQTYHKTDDKMATIRVRVELLFLWFITLYFEVMIFFDYGFLTMCTTCMLASFDVEVYSQATLKKVFMGLQV